MANDLLFLVADYVFKAIDALPVTAHPMTQFATGVMALQVEKCSDTVYICDPPSVLFYHSLDCIYHHSSANSK